VDAYQGVLDAFVTESRHILGENLTGIYLHGSAAMGCMNWRKSDLDLLVVTEGGISDPVKGQYMDMAVRLNGSAPAKGLEFSIIRKEVCSPFVYSTPFELHFSIAHLAWYRADPAGYIEKMRGTDRDLAAHVMVLHHRGRALWGKRIDEVFSEVSPEDYWDSIVRDIENAASDIREMPVYMILNLCRVLAYKRDRLILSKSEGGEWGIARLPSQYGGLIHAALAEYRSGLSANWDKQPLGDYAAYMLAQIHA